MDNERDGQTKRTARTALPRGRCQGAEAIAQSAGCDAAVCAWYVAYSLRLRNLEKMIAERGIKVDHSSVRRWVIKRVPLFEKALRRHKRPVGKSWRMDEAYIKLKGQWKYLYRAVNEGRQHGRFCAASPS
ncbi:hypothetical protein R69746_08032 [Paraburkholderia aspalathi]|nr:hypothetical protein R69746_08032 [Paraburkholderia aspalathi]